jgi:cell division control protein 6
VFGKSGSGKSTVTKFVCENLEGVSCRFVNLRKAKTVFGCANLILGELGEPSLKSAQGINLAIDKISIAINTSLKKEKSKLFVLVLDESDVLFYDKRGKPSDFIYKLLVMEEKLKEDGSMMTIVAISNNVVADYEIDDRVRSRIGSSEVFFAPYSKNEVLEILKDRAVAAFSKAVDPAVLEYCANLSSEEHGDARRAIDLLRVAAEIASGNGQPLATTHVDLAVEQVQKDRASLVLSTGSYHFRLVAGALAQATYVTGEVWHSTSTIYDLYKQIMRKGTKPLTYRRVSELLTEVENTGLAVSQTSSKGRYGYGTQYKLTVLPEVIGRAISTDYWKAIVARKEAVDKLKELEKGIRRLGRHSRFSL